MQTKLSKVFNALGITAEQLEKALLTEVDRFCPDEDTVEALIDGTSGMRPGKKCLTQALFTAVSNDKMEVAWSLLDHGADLFAWNEFGDTPLLAACRHSSLATARMLVDRGAEVNVRDRQGQTPLMAAARFGNLELAKLLIANRAITDIPSGTGATALSLAEQYGRTEIAALLKPRAPSETTQDNAVCIDDSVRAGHHDIVALLNRKPLSPEEFGPALVKAVYDADAGPVSAILESQPDLKAHQHALDRALFTAARTGKKGIAELLLGGGANIEARDHQGDTPLIAAARGNFDETAAMLVSRGADMQAIDREGRTPLMFAAYWGNAGMAKDMLAKGARAESASVHGETAIFFAENNKRADLVALLKASLPQQPEAAPKMPKAHRKKHHGHKHG